MMVLSLNCDTGTDDLTGTNDLTASMESQLDRML